MQKQRLQETMSGIKEYPELDSLCVQRRDKHRRKPASLVATLDPVDECESNGFLCPTICDRSLWHLLQ